MPFRGKQRREFDKLPTVWAKRITLLMWATGEHTLAMMKRLKLSCHDHIDDILHGKKGKLIINVEFAYTLQRLEEQFAEDLKALDEGKIKIVFYRCKPGRGEWREFWRSIDKRKSKRKADKKAMAALGLFRKDFPGRSPSKNDGITDYGIAGFCYLKDEFGRPKTYPGQSGTINPGVS